MTTPACVCSFPAYVTTYRYSPGAVTRIGTTTCVLPASLQIRNGASRGTQPGGVTATLVLRCIERNAALSTVKSKRAHRASNIATGHAPQPYYLPQPVSFLPFFSFGPLYLNRVGRVFFSGGGVYLLSPVLGCFREKEMAHEEERQCMICLCGSGDLIRKGCACRGSSALVHGGCALRAVVAQLPHRGERAWAECQTCCQVFTGPMCVALANAWLARTGTVAERHRALSYAATASQDMGEYARAERTCRYVLATNTTWYGPTHEATVRIMGKLASALWHQEKHAESEALRRRVVWCRVLALGTEHPLTLVGESDLALSLSTQEKYDEAEKLFDAVIAAQRRVLGREHAHTLVTMSNHASMLSRRGDEAAAERVYREAIASHRRVLGDAHPHTMLMDSNLARCIAAQGRRYEASAIYDRVVPMMREIMGAGHPDTVECERRALLLLVVRRKENRTLIS